MRNCDLTFSTPYSTYYIFVYVKLNTVTKLAYIFCISDASFTPINPYIRHWEAAHYDRTAIDRTRRAHDVERRRKKRAAADASGTSNTSPSTQMNYRTHEHGSAKEIRMNFFAHDR